MAALTSPAAATASASATRSLDERKWTPSPSTISTKPRSVHSRRVALKRPSVQVHASAALTTGLDGSRLPSQFLELGSQEQLDSILEEASKNNELVLIEWMAQWCRKCIYLKPKIEKIVHEYPRVRCCVVDVNQVPFSFVKSANINKMPTLQLYVKGQQVEELIGGEAAWQVLDNVRQMIKKHA